MFEQRRFWLEVEQGPEGNPIARLNGGKVVLLKNRPEFVFRRYIGRFLQLIIVEERPKCFIAQWTGRVASLKFQKKLEEEKHHARQRGKKRRQRMESQLEAHDEAEKRERLQQEEERATKPSATPHPPRVRFIS